MARSREAGNAYRDRLVTMLARGPRRPSDLSWRAWWRALGRTVAELLRDNLPDRAALLTYYGILAIFPGLLVMVASVRLLGGPTSNSIVEGIRSMTFGPSQQIIADSIANLETTKREAGIVALVSLAVAFYSATGYVGAFMRAANAIYDVPEGRPMWKTLPLRILITVVTGLFLAFSALVVVFTGRLADQVGVALKLDPGQVRVFDIAKWPTLAVAFALLLALLYWAAPNARQGGFRWITPGSLLATAVWVAASGGVLVLCHALRLLQPDLRRARRRDHLPGMDVAHQRRCAARGRIRRRTGTGTGDRVGAVAARGALPPAARCA